MTEEIDTPSEDVEAHGLKEVVIGVAAVAALGGGAAAVVGGGSSVGASATPITHHVLPDTSPSDIAAVNSVHNATINAKHEEAHVVKVTENTANVQTIIEHVTRPNPGPS